MIEFIIKKIGILKCITGHCYCRMLQNGTWYCCKCGVWEVIDNQKIS